MTTRADFHAFYNGTQRRVLVAVYALIGDLEEARDVTQEAYVRAWQHWRRVCEYENPEAWVRGVAKRIAFNGWRKSRNRNAAYRRHGPVEPVAAPSENTVALVAALRGLSLEQREAVVLHHLLGLTVEEVARQTGVPVGTVKARLSRGRKAMSALLQTEART